MIQKMTFWETFYKKQKWEISGKLHELYSSFATFRLSFMNTSYRRSTQADAPDWEEVRNPVESFPFKVVCWRLLIPYFCALPTLQRRYPSWIWVFLHIDTINNELFFEYTHSPSPCDYVWIVIRQKVLHYVSQSRLYFARSKKVCARTPPSWDIVMSIIGVIAIQDNNMIKREHSTSRERERKREKRKHDVVCTWDGYGFDFRWIVNSTHTKCDTPSAAYYPT